MSAGRRRRYCVDCRRPLATGHQCADCQLRRRVESDRSDRLDALNYSAGPAVFGGDDPPTERGLTEEQRAGLNELQNITRQGRQSWFVDRAGRRIQYGRSEGQTPPQMRGVEFNYVALDEVRDHHADWVEAIRQRVLRALRASESQAEQRSDPPWVLTCDSCGGRYTTRLTGRRRCDECYGNIEVGRQPSPVASRPSTVLENRMRFEQAISALAQEFGYQVVTVGGQVSNLVYGVNGGFSNTISVNFQMCSGSPSSPSSPSPKLIEPTTKRRIRKTNGD